MSAYIARRIALAAVAIFGVLIIVFVLSHVIPGDPVVAILGGQAREDVVAAARERWGLDRPLHEQFIRFIGRLLQGDLGTSLATNRPVADDLRAFFPA
ncbi:MAG TPA: ABC transporter permease, partial [Thermoanaerobaculia bacterium]|nr:ABC transporter permease [Thermoanaerobaculia bacterium]